MPSQFDETYPDDAPTLIGGRPVGNEDVTIVDLASSEMSDFSPESFDPPPSHDEIAAVAYSIFEARGGEHGQDTNDWLEAERRLRDRGRPPD